MFQNILKPQKQPSIFLSHNSTDKKYGDVLRKLMISIGILDSDLIYTSHEKNKIPIGENIYDYLGNSIEKSNIVLFLLSEDYFKSVVCLNEMGASWITKNKHYIFFVPGFDKKSSEFIDCCIKQEKMGIVLNGDNNCRQGLREFVKELSSKMKLNTTIERIYDEVEKCCESLWSLTPTNSTYTASISEIIKRKNYIFCKIDILIPTGERFHDEENHWIQLFDETMVIKVGDRLSFKVKSITDFEEEKYGNHNFRNVYVYQDSVKKV